MSRGMRVSAGLAVGLFFCGCASVQYVAVQDEPVLFATPYQPIEVRAAVIRALSSLHINPTAEAEGLVQGSALKSKVPCDVSVRWSVQQAVVTPVAPPEAQEVDARCAELASRLARTIRAEVSRPERTARREEKRQRKRDEAAARQAAWNAQQQAAWEAQQQAAEQQAAWAQQQQAAQPAPQGQPDEVPPPPPPAPAPVTTHDVRVTNVQSSSTTHVTSNTTYVNAAPAPAPQGPQLQPNTCCVKGRAYLCPNTESYAAACVQRQGSLAQLCPPNAQHDRFCPR